MPNFMPGEGIGHFMGAMRIDAFRTAESFKQDMDQWIQRFRTATPVDAAQTVVIPGDPERELETERMQNGITLMAAVIADLNQTAELLGVKGL
jgi:LDH2 family malate/lactate/ureidoglycolate dehydrogenase